MSSQTVALLMCTVESALWAVLCLLFWKKDFQKRFPAMGAYLALHMAAAVPLLFFFYGNTRHWFNDYSFACYFYTYWTVYIVSAVLLYFICIEIFRFVLAAFAGLQRLGAIAFRWAALAAAILNLATLPVEHARFLYIPDIADRLMRSVSILELCLLAFLCLSMDALRLTVRDLAFGIALGFGLMSTNDFIFSILLYRNHSLTSPLQLVDESLILFILGVWVTYCALPEPARKPVLLPASSLLFRWNEIATALGHTGTQVALPPAGGYVLTDTEQIIESVLAGKLMSRESET